MGEVSWEQYYFLELAAPNRGKDGAVQTVNCDWWVWIVGREGRTGIIRELPWCRNDNPGVVFEYFPSS